MRFDERAEQPTPMCEQGCGHVARVYAIDPAPGGWGGYYCRPCQVALRFRVIDDLERT